MPSPYKRNPAIAGWDNRTHDPSPKRAWTMTDMNINHHEWWIDITWPKTSRNDKRHVMRWNYHAWNKHVMNKPLPWWSMIITPPLDMTWTTMVKLHVMTMSHHDVTTCHEWIWTWTMMKTHAMNTWDTMHGTKFMNMISHDMTCSRDPRPPNWLRPRPFVEAPERSCWRASEKHRVNG